MISLREACELWCGHTGRTGAAKAAAERAKETKMWESFMAGVEQIGGTYSSRYKYVVKTG
jgi:hypothetical protein